MRPKRSPSIAELSDANSDFDGVGPTVAGRTIYFGALALGMPTGGYVGTSAAWRVSEPIVDDLPCDRRAHVRAPGTDSRRWLRLTRLFAPGGSERHDAEVTPQNSSVFSDLFLRSTHNFGTESPLPLRPATATASRALKP